MTPQPELFTPLSAGRRALTAQPELFTPPSAGPRASTAQPDPINLTADLDNKDDANYESEEILISSDEDEVIDLTSDDVQHPIPIE